MEKILLAIDGDMIAARFDLATEVMIVAAAGQKKTVSPRSMLLPGPSADELCGLILKEDIATVVCGGIEDEHFQFLSWKKVRVIDRVIGEVGTVMKRIVAGDLQPGAVVREAGKRGGCRGEKNFSSI